MPGTNNEAFNKLCEHVALKGLLLPIFVHPDTMEVVSGHYRYLAAKKVGKKFVSVIWATATKQAIEYVMGNG